MQHHIHQQTIKQPIQCKRMSQLSFIFTFCILFFFLIPIQHGSLVITTSTDLVNQTCKTCSNDSTAPSCLYDFCVTSLQPIPISHVTNLQGLAILAMELALQNATTTLSTINELMDGGGGSGGSGGFDPHAMACMEDCLELYLDAVAIMVEAVGTFLNQQYEVANMWVRAVMEAASICESAFAEKEGEVSSPLTKENYNLVMLCKIAVCIINLLTLASSSVPS